MRLSVAIIEAHLYWEFWLRQIGVSFVRSNSLSPDFPVAIINSQHQPQDLADYLNTGMHVIITASQAKNWRYCGVTTRKVRWIQGDTGIFQDVRPFFVNLKLTCPQDANALCDQDKNHLIKIEPVGRGNLIIIPDELILAAAVSRSARMPFPTFAGKRSPTERVCMTNKSGIREVLGKLLKCSFHAHSLPFAFLWPYPDAKQSWFAFRIDTDFATPEDVKSLANLLEKAQLPATWFVETRSVAHSIDQYKFPPGHEVALHCYRHAIYHTVSENRADIRRGVAILQKAGYAPVGYAAPFGEWQPVLAKALAEEGFEYSSEFVISYDDYPFYPIVEDAFAAVLQIPIHPISVGRLRWAKFSASEMIAYYCAIADELYARNLPIIFYHHPGQNRLSVWEVVFQHIAQKKALHYGTFDEFNKWWKLRYSKSWEIEFQNGIVKTKIDDPKRDISIALILPDNSVQHLPLISQQTEVNSNIKHSEKPVEFSTNLVMDFNKRRTLQSIIHDITWFRSRRHQRKQSE